MPQTTDLPYLVTLARDHTLKLHRSTCKKALANTSATPTDKYRASLNGNVATPATCCKPKPPKPCACPEIALCIHQNSQAAVDRELARRAAETGPPATSGIDVHVRFMRNGKPMPDSQNKLASVAYYHTRDVIAGTERCQTAYLRGLLRDAGVAHPEAAPWGPVTLPNGVVLEAVVL